MNDLTRPPLKDPTAPIVPAAVWQHIHTDPWVEPANIVRAKIIDARDGWVRYYLSESMPDQRERESEFRLRFEPAYVHATGALLKAPVPRDELEGALADMLLHFHYREGNFADRDAAVRRAAAALGQQVQL